MEKEKMSHDQINNLLNKKSGLLGISKLSSDMRVLEQNYDKDPLAKLAIDLFCYNVIKYVGAYAAVLNGVDAIIFTGGIGEKGSIQREKIVENLGYLGIKLDKENNNKNDPVITTADSKVPVFIIRTNEELQMVRETMNLLGAEGVATPEKSKKKSKK